MAFTLPPPLADTSQHFRSLQTVKAYAGVGARKTPPDVLQLMRRAAGFLSEAGWTLYSGGADGADTAFQEGSGAASGAMHIFLPWPGFNGIRAEDFGAYYVRDKYTRQEAEVLTAQVWDLHAERCRVAPWDRLKRSTKTFMTRNAYQVLGGNLARPVRMLICWTPDGITSWKERTRKSGGTGQAVALASLVGVEVLNLRRPEHRERIEAAPSRVQI